MRPAPRRSSPGRPLRAWISTFHSFCVRLLRREAAAAGLAPGLPDLRRGRPARGGARGAAGPRPLGEAAPAAPRCSPASPRARTRARRGRGRRRLRRGPHRAASMERYHEVLRAAGAVDFDDLLLRAVALLERNEAVARGPGRRASPTCWWTSTRTRTARSTSSCGSRRARGQPHRGRATRTSRSTPGAGPTSRTSSTSSTTSRAPASSASRRTTAPASGSSTRRGRSSSRNVRRKGKTLRAVKGDRRARAAPRGHGRVPGGRLGHGADRRAALARAGWRCSSA